MADPLSLAASIIAVLGAAGAGCKALEKLQQTRRAPREVSHVLAELTSFRALLSDTKDLVGQKDDLRCGKELQALVDRGGELIGEITTITEKQWSGLDFLKLSEANRHRVAVLRYGSRLKELKDGLRLVSLDLAATLSLLSAYVFLPGISLMTCMLQGPF